MNVFKIFDLLRGHSLKRIFRLVNIYFAIFQVTFIAEDWEAPLNATTPRPDRRPNCYNADIPSRASLPPGTGIALDAIDAPQGATTPQQGNCDPKIMNGNGPPRLRPPPPAGATGPGRSPSMDTARPPGAPGGTPIRGPPPGPPPRTRASRTPMSPDEIARRSQAQDEALAAQQAVRDCFIIPQESVERFLPDGISVRKF